MNQKNEIIEKDNELAEFADRILIKGRAELSASTPDEELLSLEKTLLRLSGAFPPDPLDEAKSKQMLVRLKARMRREEEEQAAKPSFWKRLFDFQANPQVGLLVAVAAVVILVIVTVPSVEPPDSTLTGTAFSGTGLLTAAGMVMILLVLYWLTRKK